MQQHLHAPVAADCRYGVVVIATEWLCNDVTPPLTVTVTSQSGRPASNDAIMFSICNEKKTGPGHRDYTTAIQLTLTQDDDE